MPKLTEYIQENKRRIYLQWDENAYEELEKNVEYGSLILRFFSDSLENDRQRVLFHLGTLKGVVDSFEHLLYEKGEELRMVEARRTMFSHIKHLDDVIFALETHGSMTHTELCVCMKGMNAPTLTEAMKKILDTGLVTAVTMGKYKIYSLTDTGLSYGKMARKEKDEIDTDRLLNLLQSALAHLPAGQEQQMLKEKVASLFAENESPAGKSVEDIFKHITVHEFHWSDTLFNRNPKRYAQNDSNVIRPHHSQPDQAHESLNRAEYWHVRQPVPYYETLDDRITGLKN